MTTFVMDPKGLIDTSKGQKKREGLGSALLLHNAHWFTNVRWIIVLLFLAAGFVFYFFSTPLERIGIFSHTVEYWIMAAALAVANIFFVVTLRGFQDDAPVRGVKAHLWAQIAVDLAAVTFLVRITGSVDTFVSFTYLFHIVISCVFFQARESLLVTVLSLFLYLGTVTLELTGRLPRDGILVGSEVTSYDSPTLSFLLALSAVFVWMVVWYFVSTLSQLVKNRDEQLSIANERLVQADKEKNQEMLVTTHELKSPFAGIESNIQVLKLKFWEGLSEPARTIIDKIDLRAKTLRERINAILALGELRSLEARGPSKPAVVDLEKVVDTAVNELWEKASERNIRITKKVQPLKAMGDENQYILLCINLVSNAINYSKEGAEVKVALKDLNGETCLTIKDGGIGIKESALPHIFDEYYRAKEAARFNKMSTGLGLAIVKEIALRYSLKLQVASEPEKGTVFEVFFPRLYSRE